MPVYAQAQLVIHDRERYRRYVQRFPSTLLPYDGRLLAADDSPQVLEGEWPYQRLVLIEFPDADHFDRWASSAEYGDIADDRREAATTVVLLVRGLAE